MNRLLSGDGRFGSARSDQRDSKEIPRAAASSGLAGLRRTDSVLISLRVRHRFDQLSGLCLRVLLPRDWLRLTDWICVLLDVGGAAKTPAPT